MSGVRSWLRTPRRTGWILAALCLAVLALLLFEQRRRESLYWHDVGLDHRWKFDGATVLPIAIEADGFSLPELPSQRHTALIRL